MGFDAQQANAFDDHPAGSNGVSDSGFPMCNRVKRRMGFEWTGEDANKVLNQRNKKFEKQRNDVFAPLPSRGNQRKSL